MDGASGRSSALRQLGGAVPTTPSVARGVQRLRPYDPTTSLDLIGSRPGQEPFKLDWNESTIPPSPRVLEAITGFLRNSHHLNWYPELYSRRLVGALAGYTGLSPENLLVTNGSDDALALVCNTFLDPADEVVVPQPTYTHFLVFAQAKGGRIVTVRFDDPFELQEERVLRAVTPRTKVIYLVSPTNPTGVEYGPEVALRVARHAPQAVVIIDEAYHEFAGRSVIDLVRSTPNLVVTRTFSKSFGMAGLRIGYLAASAELVQELKRLFNPKSVNVLGQIAAEAALSDREYLDDYVAEVTDAKALLVDHLVSRGLEARTTPGNFVCVRLADPKGFCLALEDEGVYIRDRSGMPQLDGYVRMSVGTREQTVEVLRRIDRVLDSRDV